MASFRVVSASPVETAEIARVLATRLTPGDTVLLSGELATGKTTFVKAVADALGSADLVTSPTFTLAQFYAAGHAQVLHLDAYRLDDITEYRDLGLEDYLEASINLIEWGEKVASEFPCHLSITFRHDGSDPQRRLLVLASTCPRWESALAELEHDVLAAVP